LYYTYYKHVADLFLDIPVETNTSIFVPLFLISEGRNDKISGRSLSFCTLYLSEKTRDSYPQALFISCSVHFLYINVHTIIFQLCRVNKHKYAMSTVLMVHSHEPAC